MKEIGRGSYGSVHIALKLTGNDADKAYAVKKSKRVGYFEETARRERDVSYDQAIINFYDIIF